MEVEVELWDQNDRKWSFKSGSILFLLKLSWQQEVHVISSEGQMFKSFLLCKKRWVYLKGQFTQTQSFYFLASEINGSSLNNSFMLFEDLKTYFIKKKTLLKPPRNVKLN